MSSNFTFAATTGSDRVYLALYVESDMADNAEYAVYDVNWEDNDHVIPPYASIDAAGIPLTITRVPVPLNPANEPILRSQKKIKPLGDAITFTPDRVRSGSTVDISWPVPLNDPNVDNYTVYYKWQGQLHWTQEATVTPIIGGSDEHVVRVTPPTDRTGDLDYYIEGVDEAGFVKGLSATVTVLAAQLDFITPTGGNIAQVVSGALQWSQVPASTAQTFPADKDIVLVFNKELTPGTLPAYNSASPNVDYGSFYYNDGSIVWPSSAVFTAAGRTLTINPAHLLVAGEKYEISFRVTAADGDILEYNVSKSELTGAAKVNVTFTAAAASADPRDEPIDLGIRVVNLDTNPQNLTGVPSVPNEIVSIGLAWAIPEGGDDLASSDYTIANRLSSESSWTSVANANVTRANSTPVVVYSIDNPGVGTNKAIARASDPVTVVYGVTATNKQGFALVGTTDVIVRAPVLALVSSHGSRNHVLTALELDEDIVFEFNRPVTAATVQMYFVATTGAATRFDAADFTINRGDRHVTIRPVNVLAAGSFMVKLTAQTADSEFIADNAAAILPFDPSVKTVQGDISVTTSGTSVGWTVPFIKAIRSFAPAVTVTGGGVNLAPSTANTALTWGNLVIPAAITQPWTVYAKGTVGSPSTWTTVDSGTYSNSSTGTTARTISTGPIASETHTSLRPIVYLVESADSKGFLVQGTATVTFRDN